MPSSIQANWRTGVGVPTPGDDDATTFSGTTPEELAAYALGNTGHPEVTIAAIEVSGSIDDYLVISVPVSLAADDVVFDAQFSDALQSWQGDTGIYLGCTPASGATTMRSWRAPLPVGAAAAPSFARVGLSVR